MVEIDILTKVFSRVVRLLDVQPVQLQLEWMPQVRGHSVEFLEALRRYVCVYLPRQHQTLARVRRVANAHRFALRAKVICPADAFIYGRVVRGGACSWVRDLLVHEFDDSDGDVVIPVGRGEVGALNPRVVVPFDGWSPPPDFEVKP